MILAENLVRINELQKKKSSQLHDYVNCDNNSRRDTVISLIDRCKSLQTDRSMSSDIDQAQVETSRNYIQLENDYDLT
jgi:hypothetical protein